MKPLYSPRTRTVLLAALLTVTGLVAYKSLEGRPSDQASRHAHEQATVGLAHDALSIEIEQEAQEKLAQARARLEELRIHLDASAPDGEQDLHEIRLRIERDVQRALSAAKETQDGEQVMIAERFDVSDGGTLRVDVPGADVEVLDGDRGTAEVTVLLSGRNMEQAKDHFERLRFEVVRSGNDVIVRTDPERRRNWSWRNRGGAHIRVVAQVPQSFNADVSTSGGDIDLQDMNGQVNLKTSGGDVTIGRAVGPEVNVKTSGGDIEVGRLESERISLNTSGGDIQADVLDGGAIDVRTSGGDIEMGRVHGETKARTSGGRISFGGIDGALDAGTSGGRIEVAMLEPNDVTLRTSGGSIVIEVPRGIGADVSLRGGSVRMDDGVQFSGELKKQYADGEINGGGPRIDAVTSGGSVTLRTRG